MNPEEWFAVNWFLPGTLEQFSWENPYFLYAIPVVLVLFWLRASFHSRERQFLFLSFDRNADFSSGLEFLRFVYPVCMSASVLLVLVGLARPQTVKSRTDKVSSGIDICILLDISDSMLEKDISPNRLTVAKKMASQFVRGRIQDRIGLTVFAGEAYPICPLTTDYSSLLGLMEQAEPSMIPVAGTAIGSALGLAVNTLKDSKGPNKVVILVSDGDFNSGSLDPQTAARMGSAYGIKIYSIGMGRPGRKNPSDSLAGGYANYTNSSELKAISGISGGNFYWASDGSALGQIFDQINKIEKVDFKEVQFREVRDFYRPYLYWAIVFLLIAITTKSTFMTNVLED